MLTIQSLSAVPDARAACIAWSQAEWGETARFSALDWDRELQRIEDHPVDQVFVALDGNRPVGMAWMIEHEETCSVSHLTPWLSSLVVDPDHRDQGVAAALMAHVEAYAATGGDTRLFLLTETPGVYFTRDWEVLDTASLAGRSVFVMQKTLAPAP